MGVVAGLADDVVVMYGGRVMEQGPVDDIFAKSLHPYTWRLINSVPELGNPDRVIVPVPGIPPNPKNLGAGCPFGQPGTDGVVRCSHTTSACSDPVPFTWRNESQTHGTACVHEEVPA
jgi:oligopeptide transport system ATP-binding protein